jgi:4a-hydroxytetrahydrobiopterin dehydratase
MSDLLKKKCRPCEGGMTPLPKKQVDNLLREIPGWKCESTGAAIYREYIMKNFLAAIDLVNKVAQVAESEDHHPDIHLTGYRRLRIELSTHAIGGLSENDFIVAAKVNQLPAELKE